ncbi:hypothetical protein ACHAXT_002709 [Thalassiosira profunda]
MAVRGDDDVLALLDEMGGGGSSSPSINVAPQPIKNEGVAAQSAAGHQTICNVHLATLAAAYRLGPPSNPHVELARHRRHEKFKAGFYDLFRACAPQDPNAIGGKQQKPSSGRGDGNPQWERNKRIKSIIRSVWKGMPPHSVWERYQFSLKTLEAECVREMQAEASGSGGSYIPPWCQHATDAERVLQQLVCPTVHQIHAWIVAGRSSGTVWEPLLPVQSISSSAYEARSAGMQRIELKYRNGSMELLREEVEFQFRRALKQRKPRGGGAKPLSIDEIYASLKELGGDGSEKMGSGKEGKAKKSKKEKKRSKKGKQDDRVPEDSSIDKEEHALRTIFQSDPFQKLRQKLHRKFSHLADESYSAFLSELQKLSNRLLVEEQGRSGGKKRKRKSGSGGMPQISYVEYHKGRDGHDAGGERQLMVTFAGVSMKINKAHKGKLQSLYQQTLSNILGGRDDERYLQQFPQLLFAILLRYDALEGAGLQSAVPQGVFHCLGQRFGCQWECFASPFNCWYEDSGERGGRYGSAFGDTDALFGSAGSFFGVDFDSGGCFQANPPFASAFIEKMCTRMNDALAASKKRDGQKAPLMFVIFVPAWTESLGWKAISSSPHLSRHVLLSQKDDIHYYAEGTQHRRALGEKGTHRIASFDTSVFFLQNDAAKEKWSLDEEDDKALKAAFSLTAVKTIGKGGGKRKDTLMEGEAAKQSPVKPPPQAAKVPTKREKTKESHSKKDNKQRKGKLMAGGQDEMSILASMGILDGGSTKDKSPQSSSGGGQKKKKRRKK